MANTSRATRLNSALPTALVLLSACFTGCASPGAASSEPPTVDTLHSLAIFNGTTGERVSFEVLHERIDHVDTVVIGELHGHPLGLPFAALLFDESLERNPDGALALEFVTRDQQPALDEYLAGQLDLEQLEQGMKEVRGTTVVPHGPMIETARAAGRPVFAANAPRVYTTTAREQSYAALKELGPEEQQLFSLPPVMPAGGYRDRFYSFMGYRPEAPSENKPEGELYASPLPSKSMEAVFRSQSLWDGTMSATTVRALQEGNRPVFLVVGQFHCDNDGGTLQLLRYADPSARHLVVSVAATWSDELLEEDRGRAHFIVYVGPFPGDD